MQAIIYNGQDFQLIEKETPFPTGRDILVKIKAISLNPIDTKVRKTIKVTDQSKILGWDAAGIVEAIGEKVEKYHIGDEVFYAGDITRDGSYATHQIVDERLVGIKPTKISFEDAAALPLTSITAWESLFDRMKIDPRRNKRKRLLIIGGAGGVGSIAIQLAKKVAGLKVIATASREDSKNWCRSLGADGVLDHRKDLKTEMDKLKIDDFDYIFCLSSTDHYFKFMADAVKPQGSICCLVSSEKMHDLNILKRKSVSFNWEFMFTRSMFCTDDIEEQRKLLNKISELVDSGELVTTAKRYFSGLNVDNISRGHKLIEGGKISGKTVLFI